MNTATLIDMPEALPSHPARYTDVLLPVMAKMLQGSKRILDPFGGTGKVFLLEHWLGKVEIQATEIEKEWADKNPRTTHGNALALPWADGYFDAVCTSPAYGNRMADKPLFDKYQRNTYANELGRELHPDSGARLQWGEAYRDLHIRAWLEARRVLELGGVFVLNIKNHIRDGKEQLVTEWHIEALCALGFCLVEHEKIETPGNGFGAWRTVRIPYESVILFRLEDKP